MMFCFAFLEDIDVFLVGPPDELPLLNLPSEGFFFFATPAPDLPRWREDNPPPPFLNAFALLKEPEPERCALPLGFVATFDCT